MTIRLLRGGSYDFGSGCLRSSFRIRYLPVNRYWNGGFRLVVRRAE